MIGWLLTDAERTQQKEVVEARLKVLRENKRSSIGEKATTPPEDSMMHRLLSA